MHDFNPSLDRHVRTKSRGSPFHCPYRHCTFTVCCSVFTFPVSSLLYLHCLSVAQCSPFHRPYRHCTFTVCCSVFTFPLSSSVTVPSLSVVQCTHFHCPHHCTFTVCCPVFTFPRPHHCTFTVCCPMFTFPLSSLLYLHCLLSSVHLSTVLITVPSLSVVQCSPFHCPHHCTFRVCPLSAAVDSSCAVKLHPVLHCSS